ncbi:MAG: type 1 glutamine amidotransferase [Bauldia sp.]|nr:MAG: type 1 glutamine amidotransferase [Bauldia sp.]MBZ0229827.1 type 1 glutamine amidotransferase [Bauldia sp.]
MRVLVVENFAGTPLGQVGTALLEAGAGIDLRRAHLGEPLPEGHAGHDGLVVLGGGQSALDDDDHPFLPAVAALGRTFGAADKAVLGICLGAQLVARGHGAENILGRPVEFGWHEVRATESGRSDPLIAAIGGGSPVFHWHADTFTLPPGAVHLATSGMTAHQAFRIGRAVYGIQFHFEADRSVVAGWNGVFADEIASHTPDWADRYPLEAARHGARADATGLAIARRWVGLIEPRDRH